MKVYGFAVVDKYGNLAPTRRKVYDTRAAAAVGFNHFARSAHYFEDHKHLSGKKLSEQNDFRVVGLVAADE
jgi:hypothetical protein